MTSKSYDDAVSEALDRLRNIGYEHGRSFVNHAPMAAEALACMGHADDVPAWVEQNLRTRSYHDVPQTRWLLSAENADDWTSALGDFSRVADWSAMFERELALAPWTEVLARWWPRLLPGMSGALTHGVIRTAHAVRALAPAADDPLKRAELAHGLGYWAARYSAPRPGGPAGPAGEEPAGGAGALAALDELVAESAGFFARTRPDFPIPLIHAVTAPAAVRLACEHLPQELHRQSYLTAAETSATIQSWFGNKQGTPVSPGEALAGPRSEAELIATAIELGDEHAIKLVEVAVRHNALAPDARYAAAADVALGRLTRFLS